MMRKTKTLFLFALFILAFLTHSYAATIQCVWTGVEKIVAVGDLHGDYKNFVKILKGTSLIDSKLHWTGGKTFLVQTGDIMDRGPDARRIFDLLMQLEKESEETGGKVQMLIGNHEEMNITGISFDHADYVTVEQFISFLPDKYREQKEREFRKKMTMEALKAGTDLDSFFNKNLKAYWKEVLRNNIEARKKYISNFNEKYGNWILEHNAAIKIDDVIFVHGGISEKYSAWKLEDINSRLRAELDDLRWAAENSQPPKIPILEITYKRDGPLWYRELALENEELFQDEVERILHNLDAHYMVIAHTPRLVSSINDMRRFQGKVWIIDTGISEVYGGHLSALIIEKGNFALWGVNDEK
jgi:hypothetical protein